jgi:hypothetical protein
MHWCSLCVKGATDNEDVSKKYYFYFKFSGAFDMNMDTSAIYSYGANHKPQTKKEFIKKKKQQ